MNEEPRKNLSTVSDCPMSTKVTCHRADNGEPCDDASSDSLFEGVFHFTYCNTKLIFDDERTSIDYFGGELSVADDNILLSEAVHDNNLGPETCRKLGHVMKIDGDKGNFQASLDIEAWAGNKVLCRSSAIFRIIKPVEKLIE
jgi:hypothetical protein